MAKARYKPRTFEERLDQLLESRDLMLDKIHKLMLSDPDKPTGLCGFLDSYEKSCNLIDRIENAGTRDSQEIVIMFVDELNFEKDDEGDEEKVGS
jgi:hypothetical protein